MADQLTRGSGRPARASGFRRTLTVAGREFASTVLTKGFIIGILLTPVIVLVVAGAAAVVKHIKGPNVSGVIAVIDQSGAGVDALIERRFTPEGLATEATEARQEVEKALEGASEINLPGNQNVGGIAKGMAGQAVAEALAGLKDVRIERLAHDADVEAAKAPVATADVHARDRDPSAPMPRIALAVIPPGAVKADEKGVYTGFEVFAAGKLDFQIRNRIERKIADAIVDARIAADPDAKGAGLSPERVRAMARTPEAKTRTLTPTGEKASSDVLQFMIPGAFMLLLLMSVMTGGQYLLTTTIEEKGSRVMEVLLSAVSPMQLMVGKVLGQMCVGLVILVIYSGTGVAALIAFSLANQIEPMDLVLLVVFFFIAFFLMACLLAAVGSAVTELREAQTLQTPIMLVILLPWLLWMPISRAPNSLFSTILSMVPGINPFVMMIRIGGSEPIPGWQIGLSILVGILSVIFAAWFSAKVFRVGVLMYGKPPNLRTLIKWVRMA